jgi:aryl-alcohol dehydrogenase-like predicted oxidoreductase
MAKTYDATPAQLALAWLLAQWEGIVPIPGTNSAANVELNVAAVDLALSAKDLAKLSEIFEIGAGAGARYMTTALKGVGL